MKARTLDAGIYLIYLLFFQRTFFQLMTNILYGVKQLFVKDLLEVNLRHSILHDHLGSTSTQLLCHGKYIENEQK